MPAKERMIKCHRSRRADPRELAERCTNLACEFLAGLMRNTKSGHVTPARYRTFLDRHGEKFLSEMKRILSEYEHPPGMTKDEFFTLATKEFEALKGGWDERISQHLSRSTGRRY